MTYYDVCKALARRPADVEQAIELYEQLGLEPGLRYLRRKRGEWWQTVRVNLRRMPLEWDKAVTVLR